MLGESTPPPFTAPPGSPPTLGFIPYMFVTRSDGSGREATARSVIDTAWVGGRLLRTTGSSTPPYPRGICLLAANTDFECERDVAQDPVNDLSAPAVSPDGRLLAVARSPAEQNAGVGPIVLYDIATGQPVRALTTGADDGLPTFSPDGRRIAFNRGRDIYVIAVDGAAGSERRIVTGGLQPVWVTAGAACRERRSVRPTMRGRVADGPGVRAVRGPAHGHGHAGRAPCRPPDRLGTAGGLVSVRFNRPSGAGALRATVRFKAA